MPIFSNPIFIRVIIVIGVAVLWISTCWISYIYGHHRGYTERINYVRAKRRARRKSTQYGNIHVLNPIETCKHYAEAESVRIVATHAPRFEEKDT